MRPIKLELQGFTAFRNPTEVNFDSAELFAFSGPTGSGKSSLIDAITFALYGSISRYENPALVYPLVSQGLQEARVRFDFELNDESYTVVRVVRRQKKGEDWGAITKEARLESNGKTLAGSVKDLDLEIKKLFGLTFEQFTTCVVLPQGHFARFLHEQPSKRQEILKELLGIKIYEIMGQMARRKENEAKQGIKLNEERLKDSDKASPEARKEATETIKTLKGLKKNVAVVAKDIDDLERSADQLEKEASVEQLKLDALNKIMKPSDIDKLIESERETQGVIKKASEQREAAEVAEKKKEQELKKLPEKTTLQKVLDGYDELVNAEEELSEVVSEEKTSKDKVTKAQQQLKTATEKYESTKASFEKLKHEHLAHTLAKDLKGGDECPVCLQTVKAKPKHKVVGIGDIENLMRTAEEAQKKADDRYREASSDCKAAQRALKERQNDVTKLKETLKGKPPASDVKKQLARVTQTEADLDKARSVADRARKAEREVQEDAKKVNKTISDAKKQFTSIRDAVSKYDPPATSDDLEEAWDQLVLWAKKAKSEATSAGAAILKRLEDYNGKVAEKTKQIKQLCKSAGLEVKDAEKARETVIEELTRAEARLDAIDKAIKERESLERKLQKQKKEAEIAAVLSNHLRANAFERWILQEAFELLVQGGSKKLMELSNGDYSFVLDSQLNFDVIDHRNADEVRTARTLSGGETFLASLALALTLSEQLAEMASEGAARLESIFLDEGFGSLDLETLDLVATTMEELGARGRMVGLVTHVKELAERIPVQFRVTKNQNSSSVERVSV